MFFDQAIARIHFFLTCIKDWIRNGTQLIQSIYVDGLQFVDGRLHIPGYCKVYDEERPISAHAQNRLDLSPCYDRVRCGRTTYENVQVPEFLFPVVKSDGSAPHSFSQGHCFIVRAIRDKQLPSPARLKTPGRSLARFACTQDHNLRAGEVP